MKSSRSFGPVLALYLLMPPVLLAAGRTGLRLILPVLMLLAAICAAALPRGALRKSLELQPLKEQAQAIAIRLLAGGALLAAATRVFLPEAFLSLPRENPRLWLTLCLLYPLFSVFPQEVMYRAFFDDRMARLWPQLRGGVWIGLNAVLFGYAHLVFGSAPAVLIATVGGGLFASTYARHRSVLCSTVEHALWGLLVFTLGLGRIFRGSTVALLLGE
jgi:O-antigen/teichoic acid export membrane protein